MPCDLDIQPATEYRMATGKTKNRKLKTHYVVPSPTSVPSRTITKIGTIQLDAGIWLLRICGNWMNASGNAMIMLQNQLNPQRDDASTVQLISTNQSFHSFTRLTEVASATTITVYAYQDSSDAVSVYPHFSAIRLG